MKNQQKFIFSDCLARAPFDVAPKRRPEDGSQDWQVHLGDMDSRFRGNDGKRHGILWNGFLIIFLAVLIAACAKRALPEEKVHGFAKFALNNGAAVSQSGSDEYSPSVIQMGDNSLVLIFGSNRSCGGCSGHNLFIAKSASAYNNNSVFPAFSAPTVMTVAATPLNYASRIQFAATAAGNNVRIYLTNAGGTIQVTPNITPDGPYDTTLTTIANTAGQTGNMIGIEFTGSKLYARQGGTVNSFDPANAAGALTAMATGNSATAIGCVDGAITSRYDGFFSLVNGSVVGMSLYGDGGSLSAVNTAIAKAKISARTLTLMQGGGTSGPLMFISGTETGGSSEDLYVVDGLTVWQMWQQLEPKPPGAPESGGGADITAPTITGVSSTTADGAYKSAQNINVRVTFSENVNVVIGGGNIYLALATPTSWNAICAGGSGTNVMDCTYTVFGGHTSSDLDYFNTTALSLIGGATIRDAAGNNAVLTLPAPGGAGSLGANKALVIDTTNPTAPSGVSIPVSSTSTTVSITYTSGSDTNFSTHNVKACTNAGCTIACVGAVTDSASPAIIGIPTNGTYYGCVQAADLAGNVSAFVASGATGTVTVSTTATRVYGQLGSFTSATANNGGFTANSLEGAEQVASDASGVYISQESRNRVLFYPGTSTTATRVYGQAGNFASVGVNTGGLSADSLNDCFGVAADASGVYIADSGNHRVLYYAGTSTTATRVYGQAGSFTTGSINNGGLSANSLYSPVAIALDATGVYISDMYNHRVLFFPGTSTTASRVYGQGGSYATNTLNNGGISENSLHYPTHLAVNSSGLYVADRYNHRSLFYSGTSTTATRVYGQAGSFTTATQNNGGISATSLSFPYGIATDSSGVYIAEYGNSRVLYFPGVSTTATRVYGQAGFGTGSAGAASTTTLNLATGVWVDASGVYISDNQHHRVTFY